MTNSTGERNPSGGVEAKYRFACAKLATLLVVGFTASSAGAQSESTGAALAETLFREARRLYEAGQFAEACPKFAESHRLDPAGGTLLNLAACHEAQGKLATAWGEYQEALVWAKREGRTDRVDVARARLTELEPRLPRVSVQVAPEARVPGLQVIWDQTELAPAAWGVPMPVDLGRHRLEVRAPNRQPRVTEVSVERSGEKVTLTVEPLAEPPPEPEATVPTEEEKRPPVQVEVEPREPPTPAPAPTVQAEAPTTRTLAYVAGGVGVVSLAVGTYFGARALSKMSDSDEQCPQDRCTDRGAELSRQAVLAANVANITVGLGIVSLGAAAVLWLSSEPSAAAAPNDQVAVLPMVGKSDAGLVLRGRF